MAESDNLTPEQAKTLIDILTHHETYEEIEQFKSPGTILHYGPPFQDDKKPATPILQGLVTKFAIPLPGLRRVSSDFWKVRVQTMIQDLAKAELSESYDKGNLGIRKTLATAISSLIEYPARGMLGAFPEDPEAFKERKYDVKNPDDVLVAWQHFLQRLVYGDLFDVLYDRTSETDKLSDQDSLTQAAHEFIVVNLASFMHYTLILSPEGPALVRMLDAVNKLAPYGLIRQTLRIGNVATMINGMMRLMLAKMSIGSFTNWMGVSTGADEGMNLMQQIISTVLGWDKRELHKRASAIEKDKDGPNEQVRQVLKEYMDKPREEHLQIRDQSRLSNMSIAQTILSLSSISTEMDDKVHKQALTYLSLNLAIRDRNEIIRVLCRSNPDHLTQAVRDSVAAYEPLIRQVHNAVNLSDTVLDFQNFINDMLKLARPVEGKTPPSVEDFLHLLHGHQYSCHKFLHQVAKNGPEVTKWFRDYCHAVCAHFRTVDSSPSTTILSQLGHSFTTLPPSTRTAIKAELDAHATWLHNLHETSAATVHAVIRNETAAPPPPTPPPQPSKPGSNRASSRPRPSPALRNPSTNSLRAALSRRNSSKDDTENHAAVTGHLSPDDEGEGEGEEVRKTGAERRGMNRGGVSKAEGEEEEDDQEENRRTMRGPGAYLARWQDLLDRTEITPATPLGPVRRGADLGGSSGGGGGESAAGNDEDEDEAVRRRRRRQPGPRRGGAPEVGRTLEALGARFRELLRERA